MGSTISLGVATLELDWGKNEFFRNHSALFLPGDIKSATYHYARNITEEKRAFVRPLRSVVRRLEMMGYTLRDCERRYEAGVAAAAEYYSNQVLSYEQFATVIKNANVKAVGNPTEKRLSSLSDEDGTFFENPDPYITLRLLAENPLNLDEEVIWRIADVVEGGWVKEDSLYKGVPQVESCLVVTEGTSDGMILRQSLPTVAPDIADFFDFVDMSENYPFTGTGNLYRFCQGLVRIRVQNRILVVLDNDTAGRDAYQRIIKLDLPPRMHVALLPVLEDCRNVRTLGPSGALNEDINGKAVSIEWFLDLTSPDTVEPTVRWTSYNTELDAYQGELLHKDSYTRRFLEAIKRGSTYDYTKLSRLWDHLVATCTGVGT